MTGHGAIWTYCYLMVLQIQRVASVLLLTGADVALQPASLSSFKYEATKGFAPTWCYIKSAVLKKTDTCTVMQRPGAAVNFKSIHGTSWKLGVPLIRHLSMIPPTNYLMPASQKTCHQDLASIRCRCSCNRFNVFSLQIRYNTQQRDTE